MEPKAAFDLLNSHNNQWIRCSQFRLALFAIVAVLAFLAGAISSTPDASSQSTASSTPDETAGASSQATAPPAAETSEASPTSNAPSTAAQWLHVEDNRIVNESGETVVLRGANLVRYNWKWPDERAMKQDFEVARAFTLPADQGGWGASAFTLWVESNPVLDGDPEYMRWMDGMIEIAKENGAYVILSWHNDHAHAAHPERISENAFQAMSELAGRFSNVPNVIYAAQAEPGFSTSSTSRWRDLRDQQERMIDAIRAENPRALVGVAGTSWSQRVDWMLNDPVRRDNIFVKPHLYARMPGVMDERAIPEIAKRWPVVIGEFGTGGRMSNDDSHDMIRYADEHLSGWQAWNLSDEGPPVMLESHDTMEPGSFGQVVKEELERVS